MLDVRGKKEPDELVWDFALRSRLCCIYYQDKISWWTFVDLALRLLVMSAASGALVLFLKDKASGALPYLSAAAALAAIFQTAARVTERVSKYGVLLSQYTEHAQRFAMMFQFGFEDEEVRRAIDAFHATEQLEAKDEPSPSFGRRKKAQEQLVSEIGARPDPVAAIAPGVSV